MLIDRMRMPRHVGEYEDRRMQISASDVCRLIDVHCHYNGPYKYVWFGNCVENYPTDMFKFIHVSPDHTCVTETVFGFKDGHYHCFYSKVISDRVDILVSMKTVWSLANPSVGVSSLPDVIHALGLGHLIHSDLTSHYFLPAIYTGMDINSYLYDLSSFNRSPTSHAVELLRMTDPHIYTAVQTGKLGINPSKMLIDCHIPARIPSSKWSQRVTKKFEHLVDGSSIFYNMAELDAIVTEIIKIRTPSFNVTIPMGAAVDGISQLKIVTNAIDPYVHLIPMTPSQDERSKQVIDRMLMECVYTYCQIYDIDYSVFGNNERDMSTIRIEKNLHDEVTVVVDDKVHHQKIYFYTSFPTISVLTRAAGILSRG